MIKQVRGFRKDKIETSSYLMSAVISWFQLNMGRVKLVHKGKISDKGNLRGSAHRDNIGIGSLR